MSNKEWTNQWNPFNSAKALIWRENLEGIINGKFLPPISVDTDPSSLCNYDCIWCNATLCRSKKNVLSKNHLLKLADFYLEWGVKSTCIAGGGEPLTNPSINEFLNRLYLNNIQSSMITNGYLFSDRTINLIAGTSRWCGISVDAGTFETYDKVKNVSGCFNTVIKNIEKLTKKCRTYNSRCSVGYKYLLHPLNSGEIYEAVKLAKSIGVNDFHLRPVGWDNIIKTKDEDSLSFDINLINLQLDKARELETEDFRIYGIRHKFSNSMQRKLTFNKCLATPLHATFGADGNVHLCFDMRGREDLIMCSHYPDPKEILKYWGSEEHKKLIDSIDINDCPRCTFGPYNEIIEQVFIDDKMCRYFP